MTSSDHRIDARDWSLLAVLSVLWGGSFFFIGIVIRQLPPLTVVLLRVALAAVILLPVLWAYRISLPKGIAGWRPFFAIALLNNVLPFSLIVTGQSYISSGLASILNATTPLFTVLVMAAAGDEKLVRAPHRRRRHRACWRRHPARTASRLQQRSGIWHPAVPCGCLQLRAVGALCATQIVELAATGDGDLPVAGVDADDDGHRRCVRAAVATADAAM